MECQHTPPTTTILLLLLLVPACLPQEFLKRFAPHQGMLNPPAFPSDYLPKVGGGGVAGTRAVQRGGYGHISGVPQGCRRVGSAIGFVRSPTPGPTRRPAQSQRSRLRHLQRVLRCLTSWHSTSSCRTRRCARARRCAGQRPCDAACWPPQRAPHRPACLPCCRVMASRGELQGGGACFMRTRRPASRAVLRRCPQVDLVLVPAVTGDFGVMPGHVPTVAQLRCASRAWFGAAGTRRGGQHASLSRGSREVCGRCPTTNAPSCNPTKPRFLNSQHRLLQRPDHTSRPSTACCVQARRGDHPQGAGQGGAEVLCERRLCVRARRQHRRRVRGGGGAGRRPGHRRCARWAAGAPVSLVAVVERLAGKSRKGRVDAVRAGLQVRATVGMDNPTGGGGQEGWAGKQRGARQHADTPWPLAAECPRALVAPTEACLVFKHCHSPSFAPFTVAASAPLSLPLCPTVAPPLPHCHCPLSGVHRQAGGAAGQG